MLYELDAFVHGKGSRLAILIDRLAGDVLEYQIRSPRGGDACVYQPGNIGVRESGEQPAFAPKTIERQGRVGEAVKKFDGELAFEPAVAARCQPDLSHAAAADRAGDGVGAELLTDPRCVLGYVNGLL